MRQRAARLVPAPIRDREELHARKEWMMTEDVLLVATLQGVENCAKVLEQQLNVKVEVAKNRAEGLQALQRSEFGVVVVEEGLLESDSAWADRIWEAAGFAIPLQINFAISGCARLGREVKAARMRRTGEQAIARRAVALEIEGELKSSLTGLLLQSELALREPAIPASLEPKLRHVVELVGGIRERLRRQAEVR
jgi:hypothetical protein